MEVAHCGGKVEFHLGDDGDRLQVTSSLSFSSPRPAKYFGIYALPTGYIVGDAAVGWHGPGVPEQPPDSITVFVGADTEMYFGHQCNNGCGEYWRSSVAPFLWQMTCPYCGRRAQTFTLRSQAQQRYTEHFLMTYRTSLNGIGSDSEFAIDMDAVADAGSNEPVPEFYIAERSQQCRFTCSCCSTQNDILGRFGYCSSCGQRNNYEQFKAELSTAAGSVKSEAKAEAAIRLMISDFDACARDYVSAMTKRIPMTRRRSKELGKMLFHELDDRAQKMSNYFDIKLLKGISQQDEQFAKMMFARRHVYEHRGGVADERYMDTSGDDSVRVGQRIHESVGHPPRLRGVLLSIMKNLNDGFHSIFPPDERAISAGRPRT